MLQEAGYSAQDLMRAADDAGVRMAIFNGIVNETHHQVGDAAKLADELGGALSRTEESTKKVHRAIGAAIEGPLRQLLNTIQPILERLAEWIERNKELVGIILTVATAVAALTTSGAAWLLLIPKIGEALKLLTSGPVGLAVIGLTTLVAAFVAVKNATQKAREEQEKYVQSKKEIADKIGYEARELNNLIDEYDKLTSKTNLTKEEHERLNDVVAKIGDIAPEAATKWDDLGNAIEINADKARNAANDMLEARKNLLEATLAREEVRAPRYQMIIERDEEQVRKATERVKQAQTKYQKALQDFARIEAEIQGKTGAELLDIVPEYDDQKKILEQAEKELQKATDQYEKVSVEYEKAKEATLEIEANRAELAVTIAKINEGDLYAGLDKKKPSETGEGGGGTGSTFDTEELLGQLDKELKNIDQVATTFGDTSDVAANKASTLRKAIIELVENGIDPTNTAMGNLVEQYKEHSQAAEDAKKETYNLSEAESELKEALANIDKQAAVFGDTIDADAEKLKLYQDAITAALVNDEPVENLQKLIAEYTTLKDKIDDATTAEQNNKAATDMLTQAQEYLYRMTGKVRPEWEMFAQKLEEMAGKDGVLPEVAEQLRNLATEIRNTGEEATTVFGMKFTPAIIESFEKTKRAMQEWHNFFNTIISRVQDIYAQMFKNREIKLENWYKTEQEAIENSEKSEEEKKTALETLDEEYEQKKRELMRDRAKAEKNMAIFNVIINTARAAIEALPNLFLSGIVTALGLTQLTLVQNQPLPELAEGGLLTGDTIFRGGEGQYQEAVLPLSDSVFARLAEGILNQLSKMKAPALQAATPGGLVVPEAQVIYETNFNLRVGTLIGNKEGYRQLGREIYPYIKSEEKRRGGR